MLGRPSTRFTVHPSRPLYQSTPIDQTSEILLVEPETGKGFAAEALLTLERYCRDELEFVRLDACVATDNLASQAVLRKCGFVQEGLKPKAMLCHGRWLDLMLMGKLLDE